MSFEEIFNYRIKFARDMWRCEAELRKINDIGSSIVSRLRKNSWTVDCCATYWKTVRQIYGLYKLRIIGKKRPINQLPKKTWWGRSKVVFDLRGDGRIIIKARNGCFNDPNRIQTDDKTPDTRRLIKHCDPKDEVKE